MTRNDRLDTLGEELFSADVCAAPRSSRMASGGLSSTPATRLYEVRNGDLWYQLETALREICVTLTESTVPEFERKVDELMLVSLSLAGRRRTRRRATSAVKGTWIRG